MEESILHQAAERLRGWRRVLLLTHDRADGDAIGSLAAMKRTIAGLGHQADACLFQEAPARYRFLAESAGLTVWPSQSGELADHHDAIVILDTCSWKQLEPAAAFLKATRLPKLIIDHHRTRDDLTGASPELLLISDETAASACGMVYDWCRLTNLPLDGAAREALFAGMATDTGWFRFPSVDGRTLRAAAELIEQGVRPDVMYSRLFEGHRPARLRLLREALDTLQLHENGTIAIMWLTSPMFLLSDANPADAEDMVNEPLAVGSVAVSILLTEVSDSQVIRVNFRSRSPEIAGRDVDVAGIAAQLGGGGHARAAGARVAGKLDEVRERVLAAVKTACQR